MNVDPAIDDLALNILTALQYEAWKLQADGHSKRLIAYKMNISKTTVTDHIDAAHHHLRNHGVIIPAPRIYYLEDTA